MKKTVVTIALLTAGMSVSQADDGARFNAKIGTYGGGFGFGPALELKVAPQITFSAFTESIALSSGDISASSSAFGASVRRYFNSAITTDTYLNFGILVGDGEASNNSAFVTADISSIVFTYGKTWINNGWNFDASIGIRKITVDSVGTSSGVDTSSITELEGIGPAIGLSIGYAF